MTLEEIAQMQANLQKTFEPYQGFLSSIQKIIEPIHNSLDTTAFINSSQQIAALSSIAESLQPSVGVIKGLEEFVDITTAALGCMDYSKQFTAIGESILKAYEPIRINEDAIRAAMGITTTVDISLLAGLNNLSQNLTQLVDVMYEESEEEETTELETDFASNEELQEAITEQNENPVRFQERIANWAESKRKKYFIARCRYG